MIHAPFTPEQVYALNHYQFDGRFHPYTCGNEGHGDAVRLIATAEGWHCSDPHCTYTQNWAHTGFVERES